MEVMTAPKVTVLMPAYNAGKYIGESIQSVLDQTYSDWELLIVNDGSTDNTVEIVKSYDDSRIRLLNNPENLRLIKTLNHGLEEARGELIARLDADDRAAPNRLRLQVAAFDECEGLSLVGGRSNTIDEDGNLMSNGDGVFQPETADQLRWACVFLNPFRHSAVMFKRSIVRDELGGYPEEAKDMEDYALWTRLMAKYDAINLPEVLCDYRIHGASVISQAKEVAGNALDPRRAVASLYYLENARRAGVPPELAKQWSEAWPAVRFPFSPEACDMSHLSKLFTQIMAYEPNCCRLTRETGSVSAQLYEVMANFMNTRRAKLHCLKVLFDGMIHCRQYMLMRLWARLRACGRQ
jgi:hypothetical protein